MTTNFFIVVRTILITGFLFSIATACGQSTPVPDAAEQLETAPTTPATERDSVRVFWEHYREATRLRQAGEYEAATKAYAAALQQNGTHGDALYYLGNVHLELGQWEKASETWTRLIDVDPGSIRGHAQLAELHFCRPDIATFDLGKAEMEFERANALNPGETGPVLRLAEISLFTNRTERATRLLDDVLGQDENNPEALYIRAYMAWSSGRFENGLRELNERFSQMESVPAGPIAGEGDTQSTGGGGPAYAEGVACPFIDDFVGDLRVAGTPLDPFTAENRFGEFRTQIAGLR